MCRMVGSVLLMCVMCGVSVYGGRHRFYREMYERESQGAGEAAGAGAGEGAGEAEGAGLVAGARRVFGGKAADEDAWPSACVLLDRYWAPRCTGSVVADRWVLTAAHCVTPRLAYVRYNTNQPTEVNAGQHTPVHYLYRHPGYKVVQEDLGRGADVTLLHHDVGLVRTVDVMRLRTAPPLPILRSMATYTLKEVTGEVVQVLGFGRTELLAQGERLVSARLRIVSCDRGTWVHCMCGVAGGTGCAPSPAGVCSGDSGGPVVYRGTQVAVTSMGPVECTGEEGTGGQFRAGNTSRAGSGSRRGSPEPPPISVFTTLYEYAPLINATIMDTENALHMFRLPTDSTSAAPGWPSPPPPPPASLLLAALLTCAADAALATLFD